MKSEQSSPEELHPELLKILACPRCKKGIHWNKQLGTLDCSVCQLRYPIKDGIPVLLEEEASAF